MENQGHEVPPIHCYTNPSFLSEHNNYDDCNDLPPPPLIEDLPPPPPLNLQHQHRQTPNQQQPFLQQQPARFGHTNAAYRSPEADFPEKLRPTDIFQPIQPVPPTANHSFNFASAQDDFVENGNVQGNGFQRNRYASLPVRQARMFANRAEQAMAARLDLMRDDLDIVQRRRDRPEFIEQQAPLELLPQQSLQSPQQQLPSLQYNSPRNSYRSGNGQFPSLKIQDQRWIEEQGADWERKASARKVISTPKGRYTSLPTQDDDPPLLPERNVTETSLNRVPSSVAATQKLHEILTTPRKLRTRSMSQTLSPMKLQQPGLHSYQASPRSAMTPGSSPSSRLVQSPSQSSTPHSRALSPRRGPMTSTPTKDSPAARRCLPLNEPTVVNQSFRKSTTNLNTSRRYFDSQAEENMTAVYLSRSQSFRDPPDVLERKNGSYYQSVENGFVARTAVVPPLSPQMSDGNSTLNSLATEKSDRRSAPILLMLVGMLTAGLAVYLSYSRGRIYYYDSAVACGICCTLAGASRNPRRTWTGLVLSGLSALTSTGLTLIAIKFPKSGNQHDFLAGLVCGVSLLGTFLAVLALLSPRISLGRHRRVHSWIPRFTP